MTPDDDITISTPGKAKVNTFHMVLTLFAIIGVVGAGTCGLPMSRAHVGRGDIIGFALILISLVGLVVTAASMAISSILKATKQ